MTSHSPHSVLRRPALALFCILAAAAVGVYQARDRWMPDLLKVYGMPDHMTVVIAKPLLVEHDGRRLVVFGTDICPGPEAAGGHECIVVGRSTNQVTVKVFDSGGPAGVQTWSVDRSSRGTFFKRQDGSLVVADGR